MHQLFHVDVEVAGLRCNGDDSNAFGSLGLVLGVKTDDDSTR